MRKAVIAVLFFCLPVLPGTAGERAADRYAAVDEAEIVHLVDVQGVPTDATEFGRLFSLQVLNGFRGASEVQIPFDRIASLETGEIVDNRMPVTVALTNGTRMQIVLSSSEYEATWGGNAEFGHFRIRFRDIRKLVFERSEPSGEGLGQRCPGGHVYYNDAWKFCPYDGLALEPMGDGRRE